MGLTKRRLEEEQEGQYSTPPGRYVCHRCVTDSFLEDILRSFADAKHLCSYCDSEGAADIGVLLSEIGDAITADYTHPANELPYESQSGGYLGNTYSGEDVLEGLSHWTHNECLYTSVAIWTFLAPLMLNEGGKEECSSFFKTSLRIFPNRSVETARNTSSTRPRRPSPSTSDIAL